MAQWIKQFTDNTHATRVEDAEQEVRQLLTRIANPPSDDQITALCKSADRVRKVRLQALRAQLAAANSACTAVELTKRQPQIRNINDRIRSLEQKNTDAILAELGFKTSV